MKIAVITCYKQNDYVRARSLRTAFSAVDGVDTVIIRNRHTNWLRLGEVPIRLLWARLRDKPDAYVITFRGYEMLLFMVLTWTRQPVIFDELVNFTEWMVEHKRLTPDTLPYRLFRRWYGWLAGHCRFILADTEAHARYSAHLNRLDQHRYRVIPVSTDESVFQSQELGVTKKPFTVFYYGNMLPLHGLKHVLEAAEALKDNADIQFRIVGGKRRGRTPRLCEEAVAKGAHVSYEAWLPFEDLPKAASAASLTLGGPFGNTLQSQYVITGKTAQFLALGVPVLIGQNQVTHRFEDKVNCLMVPQADDRALSAAISWAHGHPKELKEIGRKGHELYQKYFSQKVVNNLVGQLVDDLSASD